MKKYSIPIICAFLAIIVFFTSFSVFGKKSDFSVDENRALMTMPEIDLESLDTLADGTFQHDYEEYLSDQFEFRSFWVKAKTSIMRALGRRDLNGVYFGKDDYLIEKYQESDYDSELVSYNTEVLSSFLDYTNDLGVKSVCAFVPSKYAALKSKLPSKVIPYSNSFVCKEVKKQTKKARVIELENELSKHDNEYIYYRTDHHWTSLGAYYAYDLLSEALDYKSVDINSLKNKEISKSFLGSTYDKVQVSIAADTITSYLPQVKLEVNNFEEGSTSKSLFAPEMIKTKNKYDYFLGGNYSQLDITTNSKSGKTLLLIKDSYANSMLQFLVNNYSRIIVIDLRYYQDDLYDLLDEETDINSMLILFNTEKFMIDENLDFFEPYEEEEEFDDGEVDDEEIDEDEFDEE